LHGGDDAKLPKAGKILPPDVLRVFDSKPVRRRMVPTEPLIDTQDF
jgi:hypothetical protein